MNGQRKVKRAITLAGGGPSAGLHIGSLMALEEAGITFDVWSLSCIGAWVGIVYNTRPERKAEKTYEFFRDRAFRDDATYRWFPVNRAFAPNAEAFAKAWAQFMVDRWNLDGLVDPAQLFQAWLNTLRLPWQWHDRSALNGWLLNDVWATLPASRYFTGMAFLSGVNGLANIHYEESQLLADIGIERLEHLDTEIYHNAWDVGERRIQLFHNRPDRWRAHERNYRPITKASLCACSALPYVEQTVKVDHKEYSEGALIDTVNFRNLVEDHGHDLDQIWVSRIVDPAQVQSPKNLHDGLANLCQLFAGEVGQNDVKLFRHHLRKSVKRMPRIVEIPIVPDTELTFEWRVGNLDRGVDEGYRATAAVLRRYPELMQN